MMNYQQALDFIYSFIDHQRKPAHDPQAAALNVQRVAALLDQLGRPQDRLRIVHVTGTKGKGSTCALIEAILRAAGLRVGLYTSPHLHSWRERIQVDRQLISRQQVADWAEQLQALLSQFDTARYGQPTTFDLSTCLALLHFQACDVDAVVLEVGLGGRYDSTNVVMPALAVITNISLDHMNILGTTVEQIAYDKAGIIKPGVAALTGPQTGAALQVLEQVANQLHVPLYQADQVGLRRLVPVMEPPMALHVPKPGLAGAIQIENARVAAAAALLLRQQGWQIDDLAIARGIEQAWWPGRMEVLAGQPRFILDGAHNGYSAERLIGMLREEFGVARPILVLGTSRDKDLPAIIKALVPHAGGLVLTRSRHPRALVDLDVLIELAQPYLRGPLLATPDIPEALEAARSLAGPQDTICVTGSLFVVAAAREALGLPGSEEAD